MSPTRRDFLRTVVAGGAAAAVTPGRPAVADAPPFPGHDFIMVTLFAFGDVTRGGNAHLRWDECQGWTVDCTPLEVDTTRRRDRDDVRWRVRASDYGDVDTFLRAVIGKAMPPKPRILRATRAEGYTDWDGDVLRGAPDIPRWELDDDFADEDLPAFLEANWFRVIDTRRVIRERMPWANAVVQCTRGDRWRHLRFYAQIEGAGFTG